MGVLIGLMALAALGCWLLAAGSALELMVYHRRRDRGVLWYAVRGFAFWSRGNFGPSAGGAHGRFRIGFIGFFCTVIAMALLLLLLDEAG